MAKISINYIKYPKFPKDCKAIAKTIIPKLIENHKLVVVNIIEHGTATQTIEQPKKRVYGQSSPSTGVIDIYLNEIYDNNKSDEHNRFRFLKVLVHECYHLKLGFGKPCTIPKKSLNFRELQEFYIDRLTFRTLKTMSMQLGLDPYKEPFNINLEHYIAYLAESEAYWLSRIINKFNSSDLDNKVKLNGIFRNTIRRISEVLDEELQYYFDKGYGFIDNSDKWKKERENEKETQPKTKRSTEEHDIHCK